MNKPANRSCTRCFTVYPFNSVYFKKDIRCRFGLTRICKPCHNKANRQYDIARRYGITEEEYFDSLSKNCAICGKVSTCLDHDHITKENRKALCRSCNLLLGHAQDNIETLLNAIQYLKEHQDVGQNLCFR